MGAVTDGLKEWHRNKWLEWSPTYAKMSNEGRMMANELNIRCHSLMNSIAGYEKEVEELRRAIEELNYDIRDLKQERDEAIDVYTANRSEAEAYRIKAAKNHRVFQALEHVLATRS